MQDDDNTLYWNPMNGTKKWITINDLNDVLFRVRCLLKAGVAAGNILVSFSLEGTFLSYKTDNIDNDKKSILDYLNDLNIPYFVNTSDKNTCMVMKKMNPYYYHLGRDNNKDQFQIPISKVLEKRIFNEAQEKIFTYHGKQVMQCGHVFSADGGKHVPIDYIIKEFSLPTTVILHVDDTLRNLKSVMQRGFEQCVIGLHYTDVLGKKTNDLDDLDYMYTHAIRQCSEQCSMYGEYV